MVDMSRNAVMKVDTVMQMMRKMALMGHNTFMLYTEDTYEIEEYPYFGYMRGRYTKGELKELDAYAASLGIELIPCVQMLGHLSTHLRWSAAGAYKDTANALLVGADATYRLIDRMLATIAECFTSRRLHIGMDETHDLGTGRYLDSNGYRDRRELYFEHLTRDYLMEFSICDDRETCTRLFGEPDDYNYEDAPPKLLLQFDPLDTDIGFLSHLDGFIYLFFGEDIKDFSKIKIMEEYS
jgi:hypothetical protein